MDADGSIGVICRQCDKRFEAKVAFAQSNLAFSLPSMQNLVTLATSTPVLQLLTIMRAGIPQANHGRL